MREYPFKKAKRTKRNKDNIPSQMARCSLRRFEELIDRVADEPDFLEKLPKLADWIYKKNIEINVKHFTDPGKRWKTTRRKLRPKCSHIFIPNIKRFPPYPCNNTSAWNYETNKPATNPPLCLKHVHLGTCIPPK